MQSRKPSNSDGALGFFQDKRDLLACDEREAFGFADVSHCCGPSRGW